MSERRLGVVAMTLYHTVRLATEEVRRRWPPRTKREAAFRGYNVFAAQHEGWQTDVNGERMLVLKHVECVGAGCKFCSGHVRADEVP